MALICGTVFIAGILRGFTGFGFALAAVPILTLFVEPATIIPAIPIVAMASGIEQLPQAWKNANWHALYRLLLGAILGAPIGVFALTYCSANIMRIIIGMILLTAVIALWFGHQFKQQPSTNIKIGVGMASGLLNGATAMGGPPVILFFLASPEGVVVGRASLLVYFFFISAWSIAAQAAAGLIDVKILLLALMMFPIMAIGNYLGDRLFKKSKAATYQRVALGFLIVIAVIAIARAVVG